MSVTIETPRLHMRPIEVADAPAFVAVCGEFDIVKMTASWPWPMSEELVCERFRNAETFDFTKRLMLALFCGRAFIGSAGVGAKDETGIHYLGYMIGRDWWGKGLMTEAVRAICQHGFEVMNANAIEADHYVDNPASGRVLEKAGFAKTGPATNTYCAARQKHVPGWHYRVTPERLIR